MYGLHLRSSVAEVESTLRANRIRLQPRVLSQEEEAHGAASDYATDHHFERYVYETATIADVLALADQLDAEAAAQASGRRTWGTTCTKARCLREHQQSWELAQRKPAISLSMNRRVCCGCHETDSYALRP